MLEFNDNQCLQNPMTVIMHVGQPVVQISRTLAICQDLLTVTEIHRVILSSVNTAVV